MRTLILQSASHAAESVARFIARTVRERPDVVLGLATGRTMVPVYRALVKLHLEGDADFSRVTTFNLDEFDGLPAGHRGTYRAFMHRHLFSKVNLAPAAVHFPDRAGKDPESYDRAIENAGGLDLCLAGIGDNGHLGFNEPAALLSARTHLVRLRPATRRANAHLFGGRAADVPARAISMGIGTILGARIVMLLATGPTKAPIVRRALEGPVTTRVPGSLIQTHPNALVVLDRASAAGLRFAAGQ